MGNRRSGNYKRSWKVVDDSEWRQAYNYRTGRRRKFIVRALDQIPFDKTVELTHKCSEVSWSKSGLPNYTKCELVAYRARIRQKEVRGFDNVKLSLKHNNGYADGKHTALVRKTKVIEHQAKKLESLSQTLLNLKG